MERILSKEEIAELLSAVRDGSLASELEEPQAPEKRPRRVNSFSLVQSKGQGGFRLPNFDILLDSFGRNISFSISNRVQRAVSVLRENIRMIDFETLLLECQKHEVLAILGLDPLKRNGLLIFDAPLAFSQVEIMLGGTTELLKGKIPERPLTAIELNILRQVFHESCFELNKAFSSVEELASNLVRVETNPRLVNIVPADTDMMVATFNVKIDKVGGKMHLVMPYASLDPLREKLKSELGMTGSGGQWIGYLSTELQQIPVTVMAQLAQISLSVRDILDLRVGDILPLDVALDSPVRLLVEGKAKFSALAGLRDGKKAVRVLEQLDKRR